MPWLELLGNLLLSRLISSVVNSLTAVYSVDKIFAWADSSIAYAWIQNINNVVYTSPSAINQRAFIH